MDGRNIFFSRLPATIVRRHRTARQQTTLRLASFLPAMILLTGVGLALHLHNGKTAATLCAVVVIDTAISISIRATSSLLQHELDRLAIHLARGTLVLAAILALINFQGSIGFNTTLLFGTSIAAAIVPEGLVIVIAATLAQTASRLTHSGAITKRLTAVESLDTTNLVVTETGMLTRNEPTATHILVGHTEYAVSGTGWELNGAICDTHGKPVSGLALKGLHLLFEAGALANNAQVNPPDDEHAKWYVVGNPAEGALITLARKAGLEPTQLNKRFPEHKAYAPDGIRLSTVSIRKVGDHLYAFVQGTPEHALKRSTDLWDHGHIRPLSSADRTFFTDYCDKHAATGYCLALAYRVLPKDFDPQKHRVEDIEQDLVFLGIVGLVDPLREEVPAAIQATLAAHVQVIVATRDHPATAAVIAQNAGLHDITALSGEELSRLPDTQVVRLLTHSSAVFGHLKPKDKLRIVRLAQAACQTVAMIGQSSDDIPALKQANTSIIISNIGTNNTGETAAITLLDDSFALLSTALTQSRLTLKNIRKAARCTIIDSASELMTVLASLAGAAIWGIPAAITVIQILAINIMFQLLPITAIGWDPASAQSPRKYTNNRILSRKTAIESAGFGLLAAGLVYANYLLYFLRHHISPEHLGITTGPYLQASTLGCLTLVFCQSINLLLIRNHNRLFSRYLWSNKKLLVAFAISIVCMVNIVYNPILQHFFGSDSLTGWDWLTALGATTLYTLTRLFHLHTTATSRTELIRKHGSTKLRAHLLHV